MTEEPNTSSENPSSSDVDEEASPQSEIRPLHLHTVDTLLNDLVGGHSIGVGAENESYSIEEESARSIVNWYLNNRNLWTKNLSAQVATQIIDASQETPPDLTQTPNSTEQVDKKQYSLLSIEAHRFAGLHNHGSESNPPPKFNYKPLEHTSLLEGKNGSGKTSILNAIIWALTGQLIRPQRKPESASDTFECEGEAVGGAELISAKITPITPIPKDINDLFVDTWVKLTFEDDQTKEKHVIRRHQFLEGTRKKESFTGADSLNLDPVAFETGTVMPNLLPYIQLGNKSDLGREVAKLTGLSNLVDLSNHASRAQTNWLPKRIKPEREAEIVKLDKAYDRELTDLLQKISSNESLKTWISIPSPSSQEGIEDIIMGVITHYETMKSNSLSQAQNFLGESFDAENKLIASDLETNIDRAISELNQIGRMQSAKHLGDLGELTLEEIEAAEQIVRNAWDEAQTLIELTKNPDKAARVRLFALIREWLTEHSEQSSHENCPICTRKIVGLDDPITGRSLISHLADETVDSSLVSQTLSKWAETKSMFIDANVADALRDEIALPEPSSPYGLIHKALTNELFLTSPFKQSLSSLKGNVEQLCDDNKKLLQTLDYAPESEFAEKHDALGSLETKLNRLQKALALAKWRKDNQEAIRSFWGIVIGFKTATHDLTLDRSLRTILTGLKVVVESSEPINDALTCCARLLSDIQDRRALELIIKQIDLTITSLDEVVKLGELAQLQVDTLQGLLREETEKWRSKIYKAAFPSSVVSIASTKLSNAGELNILVDKDGVKAPLEHISNASALRASIFAFFLAFWFHVMKERGGLRLLLLDDPQELLDNENRDNLADTLPHLVSAGGQLIITSYDVPFAKSCSHTMWKTTGIDHQSIHAIGSQRNVIGLAPSILNVQKLRNRCEVDENDENAAQNYAAEVRVYLECCLGDFFNNSIHPAFAETTTEPPTLFTFVDYIRARVKDSTNELYKGQNIRKLVTHPAFTEGNDTRKLMNKAHHKDKHTITPNEVFESMEDLARITKLASLTHEDFRMWAKRDPVAPTEPNHIVSLPHIEVAKMNVQLYPDVAAICSDGAGLDSQDTESQMLCDDWFTDRSFYYLRSDNFGFAAPKTSVAIVESSSNSVADGRLVIGKVGNKVIARRILKSNQSDYIALASENPDPTKRFESLIVKRDEAALHQVVGIIFNQQYFLPCSDEAVLTSDASVVPRITSAYTVKGNSAIPLALDGQIILGGRDILSSDLSSKEGMFVAVTTSDNQTLFKRIGEQVSSEHPHLLQFESIGGLGRSIILSTKHEDTTTTRVLKTREILGVLYSSSTNLE